MTNEELDLEIAKLKTAIANYMNVYFEWIRQIDVMEVCPLGSLKEKLLNDLKKEIARVKALDE